MDVTHLAIITLIILEMNFSFFANVWLIRKCNKAGKPKTKHILLATIAFVDIYRTVIENGTKLIVSQGWSSEHFQINCTLLQFFTCFFGLSNTCSHLLLFINLTLKETILNRTIKSSAITIALAWTYSMLWSICPLLGWGNLNEVSLFAPYCTLKKISSYGIMLLVITCLIPIMAILIIIKYKRKKFAANYDDTYCQHRAQFMTNYDDTYREQRVQLEEKRRFDLMCWIMILIFLACWLPYFIYIIKYNTGDGSRFLQIFAEVSSQICMIKNPILYWICHRRWIIVCKTKRNDPIVTIFT